MKISAIFIFSFFSLTSFILAIVSAPKIKDNLILILLFISVTIQISIAVIPKYFILTSQSSNKN
jgi:hypothetical protein